MKNYILYVLKSKLSLNIKGNNTERFIRRLKNNNIDILNIIYISKNEINIRIYKSDYDKLMSLKTIYEINLLDFYGSIKIKNNILNNKLMIILIFISLIFIYTITNMIFSVDIVTNDSNMALKIRNELETYDIKKYKFKKNYQELQLIKNNILKKHRNELEWIEIENIGTKYIIRYEPRILNGENESTPLRHIIALKDSVISDMDISSGQILKGVNSYVKKGDIIVSGYVTLNDNIKDTVSSSGIVYGKVWYNVTVTYPYKYYENYETGKSKKVLVIKLLNNEIEFFNFNKYKTKNKINNILIKNNLLPFELLLQEQKETRVIDENNTTEEVIKKAIEYSKEKIKSNLNDKEYINDYKILKRQDNGDSITLNIFFEVIENITDYQQIEEYKEEIVE